MLSTKLPILPFQSVMGFFSGTFLGIVAQTAPKVLGNLHLYSARGTWIILIALLLIFGISMHFFINGHLRGLQSDAKIAKLYEGPPSTLKVRAARILFWLCGGFGVALGLSENDLFFVPF